MKTYRFYIMTLALTFLFAGCSEDELTKGPGAQVGDEVQFGLSLSNLDTRTVYGEENTESKTFPIYWVNGDKVRVASPQCLSGRNTAEYEIAVDGEKQNYATSMTKTGDAGVQWGNAATADFYSIYPSSASTSLTVEGNTVKTKLHVDATQFTTTSDKTDSDGNPYIYAQPAEMGNVVMYAKTTGVTKAENTVVELNYIPFSTVLEFEVSVGTTPSESEEKTVTVQSITLTAPDADKTAGTDAVNIAGDFNFNFPEGDNGPSISHISGTGGRSITLHFLQDNQYTTVLSPEKPKLKAKMCLMPISNVTSLKGWKIDVNTPKGTFSKTLEDKDLTGKNTALVPGMVHKVILPTLSYASKDWEYNLANWMPYLSDYRNIYLTEISLPGAWYAGSTEGYQTDGKNIQNLWNHGVRAFGIETRTAVGLNWLGTVTAKPKNVVLSGTGDNSSSLAAGKEDFGTNSLHKDTQPKDRVYYNGTDVADLIKSIVDVVKNTNEFAVLVLSYADGGKSANRYVDYGAWLSLIETAYNNLDQTKYKDYIYSKQITANTTVNDVIGKLIIKINVDENIAMEGYVGSNTFKYNNGLPALFSYNPFPTQITKNAGTDSQNEKLNTLSVPYFSNLSWSNWSDNTNTYRTYFRSKAAQTISNPFLWCFSSANRTDCTNTNEETGETTNSEVATLSQRKAALKAMGNYSKQIYDASTHNVWFYYNCGGTHATNRTEDPTVETFSTNMNSWLLNRIKMKIGEIPNDNNVIQPEPSPLGIVMFNQCTGDNATYHGADIIKAIIEMNSKFYLKHAGTSGGSTGGDATPTSEVKTAAPGYDSGMEDRGTNAISWE